MFVRMTLTVLVAAGGLVLAACGENSDDLSCSERRDRVNEMIDSALSENLTCVVPDDCTTVNIATDCAGSCPTAVAKDGLQTVLDTVDQADQDYCQDFQKNDCGYVTPGCNAAYLPTCDAAGDCVMAVL